MRDRNLLAMASLAAPIIVGILNTLAIQAQYTTDWQTKAGGKIAFEVASVKPSKGAVVPANVLLTPWDDYPATNGRFTADAPLLAYIEFAYKLWPNDLESRELAHLPKWVAADRYGIEARAATPNPTKDQMRLMVQALLADRFQLAAHFAAREVPVFELKLAKTGKLGPKLIFALP
jgi:bla regulator protein blaR1